MDEQQTACESIIRHLLTESPKTVFLLNAIKKTRNYEKVSIECRICDETDLFSAYYDRSSELKSVNFTCAFTIYVDLSMH